MKFNYILSLILLGFCSCQSKKPVNLEYIGSYDFIGTYGTTINGKPTYDSPYRSERSYQELMTTCSDSPLSYEDFLINCIKIDISKSDIEEILENHEIITSKYPIKEILKNTEFTKQDGCPEWKLELVEVVLENTKSSNKIYLYKSNETNKYRFAPCP